MFTIWDLNLPERRSRIAETPYIDVAEIMAFSYAQARYGGEQRMRVITHHDGDDARAVEVRDDADRIVARYGAIRSWVIGRMP